MKKIICNLCGKTLEKYEHRFKIKVKSPYFNVEDFTAHCCGDCYEKLYDFFNPEEADNDKE